MSSFDLIIKKILKLDNNPFSPSYDINDKTDAFQKLIFYGLINTNTKTYTNTKNTPAKNINVNTNVIKNKFKFFYNTLNGPFLKASDFKNKFINFFYKIQKTYNALNKFVWIYKFKKAKIVVDQDICLNTLNINDTNVMVIFQNNSKYLFNINDLINISKTALINSYLFFSEPLSIKNPYNNIPFNKSTLYNMFFYIKFNTHIYNELFTKYFYCDFNLSFFKIKHEYLLRDYAIHNYVYKSPSNLLEEEIRQMIEMCNSQYRMKNIKCFIKIDNDFPRDKLIRIMRPYLLLYCISSYSLLMHKRSQASYMLSNKLFSFYKYNPQFGRKKYKMVVKYTKKLKMKITKKIIEFDDKHILFNDKEQQNNMFLNDHLSYDEINYNAYNYEDSSIEDENRHTNNENTNEDNNEDTNEDNNEDTNEDTNEDNNSINNLESNEEILNENAIFNNIFDNINTINNTNEITISDRSVRNRNMLHSIDTIDTINDELYMFINITENIRFDDDNYFNYENDADTDSIS